MLAAIPIDTLVFIALVLVASFFRWISKQAENAKRNAGNGAGAERIHPPAREETDEERVRRFLEALGQPTSRPPPRIEKRPVVSKEKRVVVRPRGRTVFSPLPPLTTVPPPLPSETQPAPPTLPPPAVARAGVPMVSPIEKLPEYPSLLFPETTQRAPIFSELRTLLSSEHGRRDAMILREIFGPPRSLQTFEF
jgi:hypothetical protein